MEKLFYSIQTVTTRNFLVKSILLWIIFIYLIFFISSDFNGSKLLLGLRYWDSGHYISIAENGYSEKYQFAFFPLYPFAIKIVAFFTGSYLSSALTISIVSTTAGLTLFFLILNKEFNKYAKKIFLSIIFFPTSFYLLIPYSEGLFFFLSILFFYTLRKNIFLSSIFCALAIVTRVTGFALFVVLIYELLRAKSKKKLLLCLISLIPFATYCLYLFSQTQNPFYFVEAQAHWQRSLSLPSEGFWAAILKISSTNIEKQDLNDVFNLGFAIFGVGFALRSLRFLKLKYSIYSIISISLPLLTGSLSSIPRFLVNVFPIFILVGKIRSIFWIIYLVWSIFLLIYFSSQFIRGIWVS